MENKLNIFNNQYKYDLSKLENIIIYSEKYFNDLIKQVKNNKNNFLNSLKRYKICLTNMHEKIIKIDCYDEKLKIIYDYKVIYNSIKKNYNYFYTDKIIKIKKDFKNIDIIRNSSKNFKQSNSCLSRNSFKINSNEKNNFFKMGDLNLKYWKQIFQKNILNTNYKFN